MFCSTGRLGWELTSENVEFIMLPAHTMGGGLLPCIPPSSLEPGPRATGGCLARKSVNWTSQLAQNILSRLEVKWAWFALLAD